MARRAGTGAQNRTESETGRAVGLFWAGSTVVCIELLLRLREKVSGVEVSCVSVLLYQLSSTFVLSFSFFPPLFLNAELCAE